jgi:hypothetical protein
MAAIRIFCLTYRRSNLLRRALASLCAQTFTDWVCELHNDDPADDAPRHVLAEIGDPRIRFHPHTHNWGPIDCFNHAFACSGDEPLGSLLEDDNWWEPSFLASAYAALQAHPAANVVWANMRIWRERIDGSWEDTGQTIWRTRVETAPHTFHWSQRLQFSDALHSNGAMLFRAEASRQALVPRDTPFAVIEPARERLLPGDWVLLPQILANFSCTRQSARVGGHGAWAQAQLLVAASYLAAHPSPAVDIAAQWRRLRAESPWSLALLFHLALAGVQSRAILHHATLREWCRFAFGTLRHPLALFTALRFRSAHPQAWIAMQAGAIQRSAEMHSSGHVAGALDRKQLQ